MITESLHQITVGKLVVNIVRKDIKNLHLGVYPPYGRLRRACFIFNVFPMVVIERYVLGVCNTIIIDKHNIYLKK